MLQKRHHSNEIVCCSFVHTSHGVRLIPFLILYAAAETSSKLTTIGASLSPDIVKRRIIGRTLFDTGVLGLSMTDETEGYFAGYRSREKYRNTGFKISLKLENLNFKASAY